MQSPSDHRNKNPAVHPDFTVEWAAREFKRTNARSLCRGATAADGVIHTAYIQDFSKYKETCEIDRRAIEALGSALVGSDRSLIFTSVTALVGQGRVATEDMPVSNASSLPRASSEEAAGSAAMREVRVSVIRLPPSVHGDGDHGLVQVLINIAREKSVSACI